MAIATVQEKNKRLTKEVQELKKALADMTDIVINKDKEIDRMRKRAETDFAGSPTESLCCSNAAANIASVVRRRISNIMNGVPEERKHCQKIRLPNLKSCCSKVLAKSSSGKDSG